MKKNVKTKTVDTKAQLLCTQMNELKTKRKTLDGLILSKEKELSDYVSFIKNEQLILTK
jgi:hypothetical protein